MFMFILLGVQVALAESHSLIYYYTLTHGTVELPEYIIVGVLDGCEIQYYDRNMEVTVPRQEWMAAAFDKNYWAGVTVTQNGFHGIIKGQLMNWLEQHNETENYHYVQGQFGCEVNDPSRNKGILKLALDGRYVFSFDKDNLKWTVHDPVAQYLKEKWDNNVKMNTYFKSLLENDCVDLWKAYYAAGEAYLTRKVTPEVTLDAHKHDRWFLYCNVFGFYPAAINVSWFQNGQRVSKTKSTGILPSANRTYQLKSVLELDPFDERTYSCHIDHISLPGGMTVIWEGNSKEGRHVGLIAVCVLILLSVILGAIVYFRKKRKVSISRIRDLEQKMRDFKTDSRHLDVQ